MMPSVDSYRIPALKGCFVRVLTIHRVKRHRLCGVVDIIKGKKQYKFPAKWKPVLSKNILHDRFGTNVWEFPMYLVADSVKKKTMSTSSLQQRRRIGKEQWCLATWLPAFANIRTPSSTIILIKEDIELNVREGKRSGKALASYNGCVGCRDLFGECQD